LLHSFAADDRLVFDRAAPTLPPAVLWDAVDGGL
jgi:hypothetical protein